MAFKSTYFRDKATGKTANGADLITVYTVPGGKTFLMRGLYLYVSWDITVTGTVSSHQVNIFPYVLPNGGTDATADQFATWRDIANGATIVPIVPEAVASITTDANGAPTNPPGPAISILATSNTAPVERHATAARYGLTSALVLNTGDAIKIKRNWQITSGTWDVTVQAVPWGEEF